MTDKIVAIIVTYNRKNLLIKCIGSILNQTYGKISIIVIDNASTDGTRETILEKYSEFDQLTYVNTGSNMGGAGGFSFGIKYAVEHGYEYLWIMDDDTIPMENSLEELMHANDLLSGEYGFLSSYAKWIDGSPCEMNVPEIDFAWRQNISFQFENRMIRLESASFVSILIRADIVRKVGLPIKEFFIWGDDVEYTRRISKIAPGYFVYDSQVVHEMKLNHATSISEEDSERVGRYKYLYRNRYYIAAHGAKREKILYWLRVKNSLQDILRSDARDKCKRCRIVIGSALAGIFFKPVIEYVDK